METWDFDFTGRGRIILGDPILVIKQLTEITDPTFVQRQVLTLALNQKTNERIMLKIRYDLPPEQFDIEKHDVEAIKDGAEEDYLEEVMLVEDVADLTHGPAFLGMVSQPAGPNYPYPDGMVHFILMSCVPGENLNRIYRDLQWWQLRSIRRQLSDILECVSILSCGGRYMRLRGFVLSEQHPSFLRYDEQNDKVYIVDYSFMDFTDPDGPSSQVIDENSLSVTAFGIWPPSLIAERIPPRLHREIS